MLTLAVKPREITGKKVKTVRARGAVPAVVYGAGSPARALEMDSREFEKIWREAGETDLVELSMGDEKKSVLIKDVQLDPLKGIPIHADFYAVRMDKAIRVTVPVKFFGESPVVKQGANLVRVIHELDVEALPGNLPPALTVDLSKLAATGDRFLVSNLALPAGVKVMANPADIIVFTEEPRVEEEPIEAAPSIADIEVVGEKGKEEKEVEAAEGEADAKAK